METDPPVEEAVPTPQPPRPQARASRLPGRSADDRYLGGVAGGIANRFAIDPFIVRAAFLGTSLFAAYAADWVPIVPAFYTLLWLFLPSTTGSSLVRSLRSDSGRREAVAASASFIVIAVLLIRPVFGFALGLAALAWVLLADDAPSSGSSEPEQTADGFAASAKSLPATSGEEQATPSRWGRSRRTEQGETLVSPFATITSRRRRRREPALWPLTLSLLVVLAIGGAMTDALLDPGLDPAVLVNGALIIIGGVLVLSAWRGRAGWTALLAVALVPLWVGFSVADVERFGGYGNVTYAPTSIPESGTLEYENGYGSMMVDLRQIAFEEGDNLVLNIGTTAGTVTVLAPSDVETLLSSKIGVGTAEVRGSGLDFYNYDREPFLDRFMVRRYEAHGDGCISDYWATWSTLIESHRTAGINFVDLSSSIEEDVDAILATIEGAGFEAPERVLEDNQFNNYHYQGEYGEVEVDPLEIVPQNRIGSYQVIDEFGNEYFVEGAPLPYEVEQQIQADRAPFVQDVGDRTWSYMADSSGAPCAPTPAPTDPAIVEINATIGIGTLEVSRDQ